MPITQIDVSVTTGGSGTNGRVYLGLGAREFRLDRGGNDFKKNTLDRFVLGGPPTAQSVVQADRNDPQRGMIVQEGDLTRFPVYVRLEGDLVWDVAEVSVLAFAGQSAVAAFGRGFGDSRHISLGHDLGDRLFLEELQITNVTLTGTADFTFDNTGVPPEQVIPPVVGCPVRAQLAFFQEIGRVEVASLDPIVTTVPTPIGEDTITVSLLSSKAGTFDAATGALEVGISLSFAHSRKVIGDSTVDFRLTTGTVTSPKGTLTATGEPLEPATGGVRLVGASTFEGGFLGNKDCTVAIDATAAPIPRRRRLGRR